MESLARSLGVSPPTRQKASELLRLSQLQGSKNISEQCMAAVCLDIACKKADEPVDRKLLQRHSGSSEKMYKVTFNIVEKLLGKTKGFETRVSLQDLLIRFGCTEVEETVKEILSSYKKYFASTHVLQQYDSIDFTDPLYLTAALHHACSIMKIRIDKLKLAQASNVSRGVYNRVLEDMKKSIPDNLIAKGSKPSKRKRSLVVAEIEDPPIEQPLDNENDKDEGDCIIYSDWPAHFQEESFEDRCLSNPFTPAFKTWKKDMLEKANSDQ